VIIEKYGNDEEDEAGFVLGHKVWGVGWVRVRWQSPYLP